MIRFRVWPWCSWLGVAVGMGSAALAIAASNEGAWAVGGLLGLMAAWPFFRIIRECGVATSAIMSAFKQLWPSGAF